MPDAPRAEQTPLSAYLAEHTEHGAMGRRGCDVVGLAKTLLLRTIIALPLAPLLLYAGVWASMRFGSTKIQAGVAIILGVVFGYAFGFGVANRARFVNAIAYMLVTLTIAAILAAAVVAAREFFTDLLASAGEKRFWLAAGAFAGTSIMCALIALKHESSWTNRPPTSQQATRPD